MKTSVAALALSAVVLTGCVVHTDGSEVSFGRPLVANLASDLAASEVEWSKARGGNAISGQAIMRTRGGDVKTCAGLDATLIPYSRYAAERLAVTYGADRQGFGYREIRPFNPDPPAYHDTMRKTICDAQGNFAFRGLPDGRYFVLVDVSWDAVEGYYYPHLAEQGGTMMSQVEVQGGRTENIIMTAR